MKYLVMLDDEILSNFRTDDCGKTLVLIDKNGFTRAMKLIPLVKPLVTNENGVALYLTQEHIDCLLDYEREESLKRILESFNFNGEDYYNGTREKL